MKYIILPVKLQENSLGLPSPTQTQPVSKMSQVITNKLIFKSCKYSYNNENNISIF